MSATPAPELPPRPVAPAPGECCGGGCARCVLDQYQEDLERWEREVERLTREREPDAQGRHP